MDIIDIDKIKEKTLHIVEQYYKEKAYISDNIYEAFKDFFGDEFVDRQDFMSLEEFTSNFYTIYSRALLNSTESLLSEFVESLLRRYNTEAAKYYILVYFPKVTITNDNNRSWTITELYVKVKISIDGTIAGTFRMTRAEYTKKEILSDYMHSHISHIPGDCSFLGPCLGNGPIKATITRLNFSYDLDLWKLFCLELSKYVKVESIKGAPYRYLENIGISRNCYPTEVNGYRVYISYDTNKKILDELKPFIEYICSIRNFWKVHCIGEDLLLAYPFKEYIVKLSNLFIEWYNKLPQEKRIPYSRLVECGFLSLGYVQNDKLFYISNMYSEVSVGHLQGHFVCKFKEKDIYCNVVDDGQETMHSILIDYKVASYILNKVLAVINYRYGRKESVFSRKTIYL